MLGFDPPFVIQIGRFEVGLLESLCMKPNY